MNCCATVWKIFFPSQISAAAYAQKVLCVVNAHNMKGKKECSIVHFCRVPEEARPVVPEAGLSNRNSQFPHWVELYHALAVGGINTDMYGKIRREPLPKGDVKLQSLRFAVKM